MLLILLYILVLYSGDTISEIFDKKSSRHILINLKNSIEKAIFKSPILSFKK